MIPCEKYDYIEIVCTFKYPIKLTLRSGEVIEGIGINTSINQNRQECIVLKTATNTNLIVLESIEMLEVTVPNPHVQKVSFPLAL